MEVEPGSSGLRTLNKIAHYVAGMNYEAFCADEKTVDAVERNLEIIGEATANLPEALLARYPQVPWHRMRGLRNILIHEYFGVDLASSGKSYRKIYPHCGHNCSAYWMRPGVEFPLSSAAS